MSNVGKVARVVTAIQPGAEGEVMLELKGGTQTFPARGSDREQKFAAGTEVWVVNQLGRTVYVTDS